MVEKIPKEDLLDDLRGVADKLGKAPSANEYNEHGKWSVNPYRDRFGTWNEAKEVAGLDINLPSNEERDIDEGSLLEDLQRVAGKLGKSPTIKEYEKHGKWSHGPFRKKFGGWNRAKREANLKRCMRDDIPEEELISELQRVSEKLGKSPSAVEFDNESDLSHTTYQREFGSWNKAKEVAGLKKLDRKKIPEEELIRELKRVSEELGHSPPRSVFEELSCFSAEPYMHRYGGWVEAKEEIIGEGRSNPNEKIPEEELLDELKSVVEEIDRVPTYREVSEVLGYSVSVYEDRFGSWSNALEKVGLEPHVKMDCTEEQVKSEIERVADKLGRPPTNNEFSQHADITGATVSNYFGSYTAGLVECGIRPRKLPYDVDAPEEMRLSGYGKGWSNSKKDRVRERDGEECQDCGIRQEEYLELYGMKLDVHHIVPAREFNDAEKRNAMENLITLCRDCHNKWEELAPLKPHTQ